MEIAEFAPGSYDLTTAKLRLMRAPTLEDPPALDATQATPTIDLADLVFLGRPAMSTSHGWVLNPNFFYWMDLLYDPAVPTAFVRSNPLRGDGWRDQEVTVTGQLDKRWGAHEVYAQLAATKTVNGKTYTKIGAYQCWIDGEGRFAIPGLLRGSGCTIFLPTGDKIALTLPLDVDTYHLPSVTA